VSAERAEEVPLLGGAANRGLVVRVGDTVRRPQRPTSPATHALLTHLEDRGFDGAPRFLGVDSKGREVLSYVPGQAVTPPYPAWALTDDALRSVARLLRRYHDATAGLTLDGHEWPPPPPARFAGDVVCHNDPNLDNVVFRDGEAVALIDFDLASPGAPLWDVAAAARLWAPVRRRADIADLRHGHELDRFRTFVHSYGRELDPTEVVAAVRDNHHWLYGIVRIEAERGNAGLADYWADSAPRAKRTEQWYASSTELLVGALSHDP
jgi:hypothetical protein